MGECKYSIVNVFASGGGGNPRYSYNEFSCRDAMFRVMISGDLTTTGARQGVANAQTFIGSKWLTCIDRPSEAGLSLDHVHTVTANHDYWGGLEDLGSMGGFRPHGLSSLNTPHFKPTPWQESWTSVNSSGIGTPLAG